MLEKALLRFAFWSSYAVPLAALTLYATQPLTMYFMWGTFHIPPSATIESLSASLALELFVFLMLLAIPKIAIYFWGTPRRDLKRALLNTATYLVLPIVAWIAFFMTTAMHVAWFLIALSAWVEALQIMFAKRLPTNIRAAWKLD